MGGDGNGLEWMRVIGGSGWEWEYNRWEGMVVGGSPV